MAASSKAVDEIPNAPRLNEGDAARIYLSGVAFVYPQEIQEDLKRVRVELGKKLYNNQTASSLPILISCNDKAFCPEVQKLIREDLEQAEKNHALELFDLTRLPRTVESAASSSSGPRLTERKRAQLSGETKKFV